MPIRIHPCGAPMAASFAIQQSSNVSGCALVTRQSCGRTSSGADGCVGARVVCDGLDLEWTFDDCVFDAIPPSRGVVVGARQPVATNVHRNVARDGKGSIVRQVDGAHAILGRGAGLLKLERQVAVGRVAVWVAVEAVDGVLRVCPADDALPFSNRRRVGLALLVVERRHLHVVDVLY